MWRRARILLLVLFALLLVACKGDAGPPAELVGRVAQSLKVATATTLASSANPAVIGQRVVLSATVTATGETPAGSVTFSDGVTSLGTATLDGEGTARFATTAFAVGAHSITASYGGDTTHEPSTSAVVVQVVNKAATTTALTSSLNPALVATDITFTATVKVVAPGASTVTGSVTFHDGANLLGAGALIGDRATFTTSSLAVALHTITARYAGDANVTASDSSSLIQDVNATAATVAVSATPTPSVFGGEVTIVATLAGESGIPTGTVTFKRGTSTVGTAAVGTGGVASMKTSALAPGDMTLSAEYPGDSTYAGGIGSVAHTVAQAATATVLASDKSVSQLGAAVTFTATVASEVAGFGGDVALVADQKYLGTSKLRDGRATFVISDLSAGTVTMTARYLGSTEFAESASEPLIQTVQPGVTEQTRVTIDGDDNIAVEADDGGSCRSSPLANGSSRVPLLALAGLTIIAATRRRRH